MKGEKSKITMIGFDRAFETVMSFVKRTASEDVPLSKANGRILYKDIFSDMDMPPFDKSAMDGYACKSSDLVKPLRIIETLPAGYKPKKSIGQGECSKIMTGAMVPQGADCVVMVEHTKEEKDFVHIVKQTGISNICYKGEDINQGDKVLHAGAQISPPVIAVLASVGCDPVPVAIRPVVGILATGTELVEPSQSPSAVQIRNSNSYQLCAQIERAGCIPRYFGIAEDTPEHIDQMLKKALAKSDIVLLSGGVSMGDFDFVPGILQKNDVDLKFEKVAIKPGKPTVFGIKDDKYFFGMPGNPVSTFILFELLVRPFLFSLMGGQDNRMRLKVKMKETMKRK
ncbi:MAG: molybdopterin molybdotransferase MoeA, partial [Deltaproteobacteria bacterium]|nr:molybdopterin molybdotransferase MoeA [Deltaproteobacteria bacterium]